MNLATYFKNVKMYGGMNNSSSSSRKNVIDLTGDKGMNNSDKGTNNRDKGTNNRDMGYG